MLSGGYASGRRSFGVSATASSSSNGEGGDITSVASTVTENVTTVATGGVADSKEGFDVREGGGGGESGSQRGEGSSSGGLDTASSIDVAGNSDSTNNIGSGSCADKGLDMRRSSVERQGQEIDPELGATGGIHGKDGGSERQSSSAEATGSLSMGEVGAVEAAAAAAAASAAAAVAAAAAAAVRVGGQGQEGEGNENNEHQQGHQHIVTPYEHRYQDEHYKRASHVLGDTTSAVMEARNDLGQGHQQEQHGVPREQNEAGMLTATTSSVRQIGVSPLKMPYYISK